MKNLINTILIEDTKKLTINELHKKYNYSKNSLRGYFRNNNIPIVKEISVLDRIKPKCVELYTKDKLSIEDISIKLNVHRSTVERALKAGNVCIDRCRNSIRPFSSPTNIEEMHYWLGFLLGDGYIIGGYLGLSLSLKDLKHIEKYAKFTGRKVYTYKYNNVSSCRVNVCDKKEVDYIKTLCITERKTFTGALNIPCNVNILRGIIDADGNIGKCITISTSNESTVKYVTKFLETVGISYYIATILKSKKVGLTRDSYVISIRRKSLKESNIDLYPKNCTCLERKESAYRVLIG